MTEKPVEVWDLWYPKAGATGISFARSRIDSTHVVLVHAAPEYLTVMVRGADGTTIAEGTDLKMGDDTPITRLTCRDGKIEREDIWPGEADIGRVVILPGGEAGVLKAWWNAPDHSEWRWEVEFYNHR